MIRFNHWGSQWAGDGSFPAGLPAVLWAYGGRLKRPFVILHYPKLTSNPLISGTFETGYHEKVAYRYVQ